MEREDRIIVEDERRRKARMRRRGPYRKSALYVKKQRLLT